MVDVTRNHAQNLVNTSGIFIVWENKEEE
jgi:hypothetical protein